MELPDRVLGTKIAISSNTEGYIPLTPVWDDPQTIGEYDLIVDVNGNGIYDEEIDALDNNDVALTAGLITPELLTATIAALFMFTTLLIAALCAQLCL